MIFSMREKEIAKENYEKGKLEGKIEGETKERENSIKNLIEAYTELNLHKEFIVNKVMIKYDLSKEEVEKYLE